MLGRIINYNISIAPPPATTPHTRGDRRTDMHRYHISQPASHPAIRGIRLPHPTAILITGTDYSISASRSLYRSTIGVVHCTSVVQCIIRVVQCIIRVVQCIIRVVQCITRFIQCITRVVHCTSVVQCIIRVVQCTSAVQC